MPPGARFEDLLDDLKVVAPANEETLELDTCVGMVLLHLLDKVGHLVMLVECSIEESIELGLQQKYEVS